MEATSVIRMGTIKVPNIKSIKTRNMQVVTTVTSISTGDSTALPVSVIPYKEHGYTDEQFYADLRKAGKKLDLMEAEALKEHAQGKTRKLPG